ncbi:hypothetical protein Y032_0321g2413 [Ancylostoma ceylanicum]|uniref:Uncharacterized protein n=1 Tax=Ancylostoma ceylanicum TaxID=53326 RepID=A0A016S1R2_9BILA|nr:hypothetical protein Y032_0321g2413 [Ancylostoma ceylanicum]
MVEISFCCGPSDILSELVVDIFPLDQTPECTLAVDPAYKMARTESACRLKLLRADVPADQLPAGCSVTDLLPAVNVKEKIEVNGESRLVQKKKTIYPEWEKCWDTAVTEGRILQIVLMFNQTPVVEATMRLERADAKRFKIAMIATAETWIAM